MSDRPTDLSWLAAELGSIREQLVAPGESPALYLALDQGGSASRAVLFDALGREVAAAHVPISTRHTGDGRIEHDPEELVHSLRTAAHDVCESDAALDRPVVAAGLATQRSTIVCWERGGGRALSEAISWQDRRNASWLQRSLGARSAWVRQITGLVLSPHYGASKLRWCLDHLPAVQAAARAGDLVAGPLASFLAYRMVEERPVGADPANASRTLLFDPDQLDWSPQLLEAFGIPREILPRCVATQHEFGTLRIGGRAIALRACTGDQSAAAFAFGRPSETTAMVNLGTGAFVQRAAPAGSVLPQNLLRSVLRSADAGVSYSHEGTINGAGSAIDWLRARVALDVDRALQHLSGERPEEEPPLFINGVGGLGSPFWLPDFPVEFVGPGSEMLQLTAVIESVAFLLQVNISAMQRTAPLLRISVTGGLANSNYLCRLLSNLSGCTVERRTLREATARGVAFLAAGEPEDWPPAPVDRVFTPNHDAALHARFARWREEMQRRGAVD